MNVLVLALLLLLGVVYDREALDPTPPAPKSDRGCVVIVTNVGPVVICR